jgi:uncharacterized phage protein (TIGR02218 family)
MRALPQAMQAKLDAGVFTFCQCWQIKRADGRIMGFTDHDRDIAFASVVYRAASGFTASEIESSLGLSVDNMDVSGALSSGDLTEGDLAAGVYDDAKVEIWLVDWQNPANRYLLRSGSLGRITRGESHFEAEIRGLAHYLDQRRGRVYSYGCDAIVGDKRCGVDLSAAPWRGNARVGEASGGRIFTAPELENFKAGWFTHGRLKWTSGENTGRRADVKAHTIQAGFVTVQLWNPMPDVPTPGDSFTITVGCDRQFSTCRDKFANAVRFRGFPHMPGNDFLIRYPNKDDAGNDGSSLYSNE